MRRSLSPLVLLLLGVVPAGVPGGALAQTAPAPAPGNVRERPGAPRWWNDAVFYEVFVRSFADSDGDGVGDFNGLTSKLDYLNDGDPATTGDLGVTGLWLMPVNPSPSYHGYDVTDYRAVNADYGSLGDFRRLVAEAHRRGIRVVIDFVLNHSSNRHSWFTAAARGETAYRDFYRWAEADPGQRGPWGQPVWHGQGEAYYYGLFSGRMPDLNYATAAVRDSVFAAADFWLRDVGVDGFRLDAVKYVFEEGPTLEDVDATHRFWAEFARHVRASRPDAYTVCEAWTTTALVVPYVAGPGGGAGGGLDQCFEFDLATAVLGAVRTGDARGLTEAVRRAYEAYPPLSFGTFLTNHDQNRVMDVLGGDRAKAKAAAAVYLTLPGTPYVYYGEEIGMTGTKPDPMIRRPMRWSPGAGGGFTTGKPWIAPGPDSTTANVETERADPASLLNWYGTLIAARNGQPALRRGDYHAAAATDSSIYAHVRTYGGDAVLVVVNTSGQPRGPFDLTLPPGLVRPGTHAVEDLTEPGRTVSLTVTRAGAVAGLSAAGHEARVYRFPPGSPPNAPR